MKKMFSVWLSGLVLLAVALLGSQQAMAAGCKGKTAGSCASDSKCMWVDGYKRKDGKKVSGYCRAKGAKAGTKKTEAGQRKTEKTRAKVEKKAAKSDKKASKGAKKSDKK